MSVQGGADLAQRQQEDFQKTLPNPIKLLSEENDLGHREHLGDYCSRGSAM